MKTKFALLLPVLLLAACAKKHPEPEAAPAAAPAPATAAAAPAPAPAAAPAPVAAAAAAPAGNTPLPTPVISTENMSDEQRETAKRQAKLDYSNMEQDYMADPGAQWASAASASSNYSDSYNASKATGKVDGNYWSTKDSDIGFDSLEVTFDKPVNATQLRVAVAESYGLEGITKVELQDTDGKWNTVWSGVHSVKADNRGPRTWFVQPIEKTSYKAKAARITKSNNITTHRLQVDAVQLIGS
ncbi:hypothetical protein SAMN05518865_111103 [Duganella sp. CF458]|uniref:hypothetical protein n=1 Tax=Duganella sp. CF458 TaxID=1884368 RepID=UPI0008E948E1|nr:hypothetical protein [Duganella sp. CF458]SFG36732.1 hypothetical protein SAMN05518865_111103 [Duganella sp. CF458]